MKHRKLLLIVLTATVLSACSSNKMGKMSQGDATLPQVSAVISSLIAI